MKRLKVVIALMALMMLWLPLYATAQENEPDNYLTTLNAGVANIIDATAYNSNQSKEAVEAVQSIAAEVVVEEPEEENTLFMANVNNSVNVRTEPDENSEKIGLLYKDCGGQILERGDEWTRIMSGELVGWVSNDYILFDDEANELASEVGFKVLTVNTDALRVRKEPDAESGVWGLIASGDELEVIDDEENPEWVSVMYEGETGYVSAQYVSVSFSIDSGETLAAIKKREEEEEEARKKAAHEAMMAKRHEQQAAMEADGNETRLLAALIQCESGTVNYEAQLAVGAVVMNRVRSGAYPNTISGVIYASGQFPPALNGKVAAVYNGNVVDSCMAAAQAALSGQTNVGTATHFKYAGTHDGIVIGRQVFW